MSQSTMSLPTMNDVFAVLDAWVNAGWIRSLDRAFARFLCDEAEAAQQPASPWLVWLAACVSHQGGRGHVCLALQDLLQDADRVLALPPEHEQREQLPLLPSQLLAGCTVEALQQALQHPLLVAAGAGATPLVLEDGRLYLRRFWQYEQDIRTALQQRLQQPVALEDSQLASVLQQLFAREAQRETTDWQAIACALAARSAVAVITGGPGTGKTTTVVKLLAVLQVQAQHSGRYPLNIRMAAPTGKAAARLNESVSRQLDSVRALLGAQASVVDHIHADVCTLHRLLGTIPGSRKFRHHANQPLPADVVVVDEASMVDIEMMAALLQALKPGARLVLLGDKDQLASVEAGAVLGQLCQRADEAHYTPATAQWLQAVTGETVPAVYVSGSGSPLDQSITMLRHSHRFGADSGIGQLARAVNAGDLAAVQALLQGNAADVQHARVGSHDDAAIDRLLLDGYRPCLQCLQAGPDAADRDAWAMDVLRLQAGFQLLCAVRNGDWGVAGINLRAEKILRSKGLLGNGTEWYAGRPVIVTRNDYGLGLMNGDMGITLPDAAGQLRVVFADSDKPGGVRWVLPARLTDVDTVFAMTVHKSQGSEFSHTALVLPDNSSPVLTRELLYTGITRAATRFTLVDSSDDVLRDCVQRRVQREGGALVG